MFTAIALIFCLSAAAQTATIAVVRHAEKLSGADPALTADGTRRAAHLAQMLASSAIARVWSSDFQRTRDTAAPAVSQSGAPLEIYDPRDLSALAARLKSRGENALVVGHSNTTPELVRLLGGQAEDMEEWQYDRVYLVRISKDRTETLLLHLPPVSLPGQ